jgi:hypothetical protein
MDGGELVEIPLVVLGVLDASAPESEIVLVRLEGERFEKTGIIAGMSGSPVYVRDRLVGALAFGWAFSRDPIGGVTPFNRMEQLASAGDALPATSSHRPELVELLGASRSGDLGEVVVDWLLPATRDPLQRLQMAMTTGVWGVSATPSWLIESWRRLGWMSVPGGTGQGEATQDHLGPGSMVSAVMVEGDAVLASSGTVTEVRGNQVWAFGHPFLGGGRLRVPLARSHVIAVLPSSYTSFKMSSVGETIGSFEVDRARGMWGVLGGVAPMVPVEVSVDGASYSFRAVRHPVIFPFLVGYLTSASHAARGQTFGDQTLRARIEVEYDDRRAAVLAEIFTGTEAPSAAAALASALVGYLENSSFEVPALESVKVDLASRES